MRSFDSESSSHTCIRVEASSGATNGAAGEPRVGGRARARHAQQRRTSFDIIVGCPPSTAARRQNLKGGVQGALWSLESLRRTRLESGSRALEPPPVELRILKSDAVFAGASTVAVR